MKGLALNRYIKSHVFLINSETVIQEVWPEEPGIAGKTSSSLIKKKFTSLLPVEERKNFLAVIGNLLSKKTKSPFHSDVRFLLKNGEERWFSLQITKMNRKGPVDKLVISATDIHHIKKAGEKLKASEQKFHFLAESLPIAVSYCNMEGDILYTNESFISMFGYLPGEMQTIRDWYNKAYPDKKQAQLAKRRWQEHILRSKNGDKGLTREVLFICKDGAKKITEVTSTYIAGHIFNTFIDITEKKKAELLLKESEQRFKTLAENMPIAIGSHDINGHVVFLNKHFITTIGYTYEDIPTLAKWYEVTQPDKAKRESLYNHWLATVKAYMDGNLEKQPEIETQIRCKDGSIKTFSFLFSILKDVVYIMLVDITGRRVAEQELISSHMQLRHLASHLQKVREEERKYIAREIHDEFGQLVTGLKMDISLLKTKIEKKLPDLSSRLADTVNLTDKIVRSIRRIESELRPSILDDIGLTAAIEWQGQEFEKRTNIQCTFSHNTEGIGLSIDIKSNLFRIFQESLTNIMRHAGASKVHIILEQKEKVLLLMIKDNGKGFDTKEKVQTLGLLGMKERAIMINGTFTIDSIAGQGTNIIIEVPL